ncbi:MAG TPA: hypothetical protein ENJ27_00030 [Candidatus Moranbacteria bacterium]|nr:hypothetical protein [Candidatus Moranbacteria bacterium]
MIITIGGLPGTGKGTVGRKLAKFLNYSFVSGGDLFRKVAEKNGMTMEEFDVYMKKNPEARVDKEIDSLQKKMGETDNNFVLESRLAWYFIPDSIKIKLDAEEDERIRRISNDDNNDRIAYQKESFEKTKQKTKERTRVHQEKIFEIYGIKDMMADEHFDYIVDTTNLNPDEVFEKILKYVRNREK